MGKLAPSRGKAAPAAEKLLPLNEHCDRCGVSKIDGGRIAMAKYEITTDSGPIFLCAHHYWLHRFHVISRHYPVKVGG